MIYPHYPFLSPSHCTFVCVCVRESERERDKSPYYFGVLDLLHLIKVAYMSTGNVSYLSKGFVHGFTAVDYDSLRPCNLSTAS